MGKNGLWIILVIVALAAGAFFFLRESNEGPFEDAAEEISEAADDVGDGLERAADDLDDQTVGESLEEAADDVGDAVEEAAEDLDDETPDPDRS